MKNWLLVVGFAAIVAPILVHVAFKVEAPCTMLVPSWTAGDFLAYVGALLGAVATIVAVFLTIRKSDEDRREDLRLSVLPCITMQDLRRVNRKSFIDFVLERNAASETDEDLSAKEPYAEVKIEKDYAIYSAGGFLYRCELTKEQRKKVEWLMVPNEGPKGVTLGVVNSSVYIPLVFSNVGNGPAVNCIISVVKAEKIQDVELKGLTGCSIKQMLVSSERYFGIYFDDCRSPDCFGKYQIVVMYEDTYGNRYVQDFVLNIADAESDERSSLIMAISRHRRQGNSLID